MAQTQPAMIQNKKERNRVFWMLGITLIFLSISIWYTVDSFSGTFHSRPFKHFFKEFGSYARIAFFVVLAHYACTLILKRRYADRWQPLKKFMISLSRIARQWHVPAAIAAVGVTLVHAVGAFLYGIKLDFSNVTGLLTILIVLPLVISGVLRYKRMDKKWHWTFGIAFTVFFFLHSFL